MSTAELKSGFARALVAKLELVLPSRNGASLTEVELNPQFILTTNIIFKNCKRGDTPAKHNFMLDIIFALVDLLRVLNIDPNTGKLLARDDKALWSTLIVSKVLRTAIYTNWNPELIDEDEFNDLLAHSSIDFNSVPDSNNDSLEVYTFPAPEKLTLSVHSVLEVLLTVLSNEVNTRALAVLRKSTETAPLADDKILPSAVLLAEKVRAHVLEIDLNILILLKYIATCNPYDYYGFLHEKLFLWSERGEYIPSGALQKYSHLLMHICFSLDVTEPYLRNVYSLIPYIRSSTRMQLFLYYGSWSLQFQFIYRPGFYSSVVYPGSAVDQSCKSLFDFVATVLEDNSSVFISLFSWYVLTCPSDFNELLLKPNKLKKTFNKRIRFLDSILRESLVGDNLDKFECMANIFLLGSVIPEVSDGVRAFSERYLDEVYVNLKLLRDHCFATNQSARYGALIVKFTTSAIVMNPEKYIARFSKSLTDVRVQIHRGDRDPILISDFHIHIETIKKLSKEKFYKDAFTATMKVMSPLLEDILKSICYVITYRVSMEDNNPLAALRFSLVLSSRSTLPVTSGDHSMSLPSSISQDFSADDLKRDSNVVFVDEDFAELSMIIVEELLSALLNAFAAAPQFYLRCPKNPENSSLEWMKGYVTRVILPIKLAIHFQSYKNSNMCFEAACNLGRKLLRAPEGRLFCPQRQCLSFLISIQIVESVSEALLKRPSLEFQQCFLLFNRFLHDRYRVFWKLKDNPNLADVAAHTTCQRASNAYEVLLLYALCTHDVQFFNMAKSSMRYYVLDFLMPYHNNSCKSSTLIKTFKRILNDTAVFTGFISLHKKFRAILIDAEPTNSLCQVWLLIYQRWMQMVRDEQSMLDENGVFRHYTGFLMCTSGCFSDPKFIKNDPAKSEYVSEQISAFYDRVVALLLLSELVVRVVIKDSLSSESHSALFPDICEKLTTVLVDLTSREVVTDEAISFVEEVVSIFASMVASKTDGSFVVLGLLPRVGNAAMDFLPVMKNPVDRIKLKLRICKLGGVIESEYEWLGLKASHKIRNHFARKMSGWLEDAIFVNEETLSSAPVAMTTSAMAAAAIGTAVGAPIASSIATNTTSSAAGTATAATGSSTDQVSLVADSLSTGGRSIDIDFLQMELAFECSKCLSLQLQQLVLDIPDGTKESKVEHARNLAFSHYFKLFYKVLQKFTSNETALPAMQRYKYKIQGIVENVLTAFSNVLNSDSNIGMPFALPLGYHENKKIRAIFLDIFATMLLARQQRLAIEEFPDVQVTALSQAPDVFSAAADIASPLEHNLLATSLHGLFAYTKKLDRLFETLLQDEVEKVTRASDIFRGNSCLTRLMSILAKDYGVPYLTVVLRPFIEEMVDNDIGFEVEKVDKGDKGADPNGKLNVDLDADGDAVTDRDVDIFLELLQKLVGNIVNLLPWVPDAFKYICAQIHHVIEHKFGDAALIAVGLFVFLRFFCPAIVSPETSFDMPELTPKVKRSLMQIVKVIQYMANGSLANLKWAKLANRMDIMDSLNQQILGFLKKIAFLTTDDYPFLTLTRKPYSSLRYLHKFFYTYFPTIRVRFLTARRVISAAEIHEKIVRWRLIDTAFETFGAPKFSISLQGTKLFKVNEAAPNMGTLQFAEFMAKMSAKNIEMSVDAPVVHTSVYHDGTPMVVANFRHIREIGYDINTFVYMLFDVASQVWDNKFYCVLDFTRFFFVGILGKNYLSLMTSYAPKVFFHNCARTYYYNLPRNAYLPAVQNMIDLRKQGNEKNKVYFYTQQDDPEIISLLCLEEAVLNINQDVRAVYRNCKFYDEVSGTFLPVTVKFGRKWLQLCYERIEYHADTVATKTVAPVETHMICDLTRCEVSNKSGIDNEFTLSLNRYNYQVTLISPQRQEILRLLYFAMLRNPRDQKLSSSVGDEQERDFTNRFNVLMILVFHGLLERDEQVRASAAKLFAALNDYFDLGLGISAVHTSKVTFPIDTTDFIVMASTHLAAKRPEYTYDFLKVFFNNFTKLPEDLRLSGILYISPWLDNVGRHVMTEQDGTEKMASIIRLFCKLTDQNRNFAPILNDKIWKKLFDEMSLIHILVEEIVSFAIDNFADAESWCTIILMVTPSVELCGEIIARINSCIAETSRHDSELVIQSKQLEITVLVKVCGSLFFNSYVYGSLYLPDVFLFCTLFIDNPGLEFGSDLQKLVINTLGAFAQNPALSQKQIDLINTTVEFFSSQRAKMLFGLTSKERTTHTEPVQNFNRAMSFELLCENLHDFISQMGSVDEKTRWLARWSSLSMDIAFSNSLFQRRALMVVCILSRTGINDTTAGKILKLVSSMLLNVTDFEFDCALCYCRLEQGLTQDSVYLPLLVWSVFCSVFLVLSKTYQATIHCMGNVMKHINTLYLQRVLLHRPDLEPLLSNFEEKIGVKLDVKNFESAVLLLVSKGLTSPQFKHNSLVSLLMILGHKLKSEAKEESADESLQGNVGRGAVLGEDVRARETPNFTYYYLLLLFLSTSDTKFKSHLADLALSDLPMTNVGNVEIPAVLLETICDGLAHSRFLMVLVAHIFRSDSDPVFKNRFVALYCHIFKHLRPVAFQIFHLIRDELESTIVLSLSDETVTDISKLLVQMMDETNYSEDECLEQVEECMRLLNFTSFAQVSRLLSTLNPKDVSSSVKLLQNMIYRTFCNAFEGLKLEKF